MFSAQLMRDVVAIIKQGGQRFDNVRASVQRGKVIIDRADIPVEEGDLIERTLPNGVVERFVVEDRGYMSGGMSFGAHYQMKVRRDSTQSDARPVGVTVYNVTGANARININSTDSSSNVINIAADELFAKIRETIHAASMPADRRDEALVAVAEMERTRGTSEYLTWYSKFVSALADHIALLGPFLPALTQFMSAS